MEFDGHARGISRNFSWDVPRDFKGASGVFKGFQVGSRKNQGRNREFRGV